MCDEVPDERTFPFAAPLFFEVFPSITCHKKRGKERFLPLLVGRFVCWKYFFCCWFTVHALHDF